MKLLRLTISDYRVLHEFSIDFSPLQTSTDADVRPDYALDFLVGVNGTGKSTLLRALGEIFQRLAGDTNQARFGFCIEYWLDKSKQRFRIKASPTGGQFSVQTSRSFQEEFEEPRYMDSLTSDILPDLVLGYTTGAEDEWDRSDETDIFAIGDDALISSMERVDQAIRELPGSPILEHSVVDRTSDLLLFLRKAHLPLVTLCGLLVNDAVGASADGGQLRGVFDEVGIKRFSGFSLRLSSNRSPNELDDIQQRLGKFANRTINLGSEFLLVFDFGHQRRCHEILRASGGALQLLRFLIGQYLLGDTDQRLQISVFLERTKSDDGNAAPPLHLLEWLSDGEQTFLGRMCLFTLFGESEALILLDEPEVHFNDYWKRRIVHHIDRVFRSHSNTVSTVEEHLQSSHVLISTHSSIALTDAQSASVRLLERESDGTRTGRQPLFQTFAADPSDIMIHIFGAPTASGEYSVSEIKKRLQKARAGEITRLQLEDDLNHVAVGYWSYRIRRQLIQMQ